MAVLVGAALAAGMLYVSPAQAALSCQSIPGSTVGADVKVGPVEQRVPAIANIKLCYGTGTIPVASVTFTGGTCTSNCLTVSVGGGDVDLEGVSLQWTEDGSARSVPVNPGPADGVDGMCVLSVGMPDAPNPDCFVAIGPDDPTGLTAPVLETVNSAVETALELVQDGYVITCNQIPEAYENYSYYEFCDDPVTWTTVMTNRLAADGIDTTCQTIPDMRDPQSGSWYGFCTDPVGWSNAVVNAAANLADNLDPGVCDGLISPWYDPATGNYVYFCDDPARWTVVYVQSVCDGVCNSATLEVLLRTIRDGIEIQTDPR